MSFPSLSPFPLALRGSYSLSCHPLLRNISCLADHATRGLLPYKVSVSTDTGRAMAQYPGIPWTSRPDYVALTQRVDPTGRVTSYSKARGCTKQAAWLTISKILLAQVSLPPMSPPSSMGKQTSRIFMAIGVDCLLQPSNDHRRQLARGHILPASDTRVDRLSGHRKAPTEGRCERTAHGRTLPTSGSAATATFGLSNFA